MYRCVYVWNYIYTYANDAVSYLGLMVQKKNGSANLLPDDGGVAACKDLAVFERNAAQLSETEVFSASMDTQSYHENPASMWDQSLFLKTFIFRVRVLVLE